MFIYTPDIKIIMTFYAESEKQLFEKDLSEQVDKIQDIKVVKEELETKTVEYTFTMTDEEDFHEYLAYIFDQYEANHPRFASNED